MRISSAVFLIQEASEIKVPSERVIQAVVRSSHVLSRWAEQRSVPESVAAPIILHASQHLRQIIIHIRHLPVHEISDIALHRLLHAHRDLRNFFTDDDDEDGEDYLCRDNDICNNNNNNNNYDSQRARSLRPHELDATRQSRRRLSRENINPRAAFREGCCSTQYKKGNSNDDDANDLCTNLHVGHDYSLSSDVRAACEKRAAFHVRIVFFCLMVILLISMLTVYFTTIHEYLTQAKPNARLHGLKIVVNIPFFAGKALYEALWVASWNVMNLSTANVTAELLSEIAYSTIYTALSQTVSYNASYGLLDIRAATMNLMNGRTVDTLLTPHLYGRLCQQNVSTAVQRLNDVAGSTYETIPILTPEACSDDSTQNGVFSNLSQRQTTGEAYLTGYMRDLVTKVLIYSNLLDVAMALTLSWQSLQHFVSPSLTIFGFVNPLSRYYGDWAMQAAMWYLLIFVGGAILLLWLLEELIGLSFLSRLPWLPARRSLRAFIFSALCALVTAGLVYLSAYVIADAVRCSTTVDRAQTLYLYLRLLVASFSSPTLQKNRAIQPMLDYLQADQPDWGFSMDTYTLEVKPPHMANVAQVIDAASLVKYNRVMYAGEKGGYLYCSVYVPGNNLYYVVVDRVPERRIPDLVKIYVAMGTFVSMCASFVYLRYTSLCSLALVPVSSARVRLASLSMSYVSSAILLHRRVRPLNIRLLLYGVVALSLALAHLALGLFVLRQVAKFASQSMAETVSLLSYLFRVPGVGVITSSSVELPTTIDVLLFSNSSDNGTLVSLRSAHEVPVQSDWVSQYYGAQLVLSGVTTVVQNSLSFRTPLIAGWPDSPVKPSNLIHRMLATANMNGTHGVVIESSSDTSNTASFIFMYCWTAASVCAFVLMLTITVMEWGYGGLWKRAYRPVIPWHTTDNDDANRNRSPARKEVEREPNTTKDATSRVVKVNADTPRYDVLSWYVYLAAALLVAVVVLSLVAQGVLLVAVYMRQLTEMDSQVRMSTVLAAFNSLLDMSLQAATTADPSLNQTSFVLAYMSNVSWSMTLSSPTYMRWSLVLPAPSHRHAGAVGSREQRMHDLLIIDSLFFNTSTYRFTKLPTVKLPVCGTMNATPTNARLQNEDVVYCYQRHYFIDSSATLVSEDEGAYEDEEDALENADVAAASTTGEEDDMGDTTRATATGATTMRSATRSQLFYVMVTQLHKTAIEEPFQDIVGRINCFTAAVAAVMLFWLLLVMWWLLRAAAQTGFALHNPHNMMLFSSSLRIFQVFTLTSFIPRGQRAAWEVCTLMLCSLLLINMTPMMNSLSELDARVNYKSVYRTQADVIERLCEDTAHLMGSYTLLPLATVLKTQLHRMTQLAKPYALLDHLVTERGGRNDGADNSGDVLYARASMGGGRSRNVRSSRNKGYHSDAAANFSAIVQDAYTKLIQLSVLQSGVLSSLVRTGDNSFMTVRARAYEVSYIQPQDQLLGVLDDVFHQLPTLIASAYTAVPSSVVVQWVDTVVEMRDVLRKMYILDHIMLNNNFLLHCTSSSASVLSTSPATSAISTAAQNAPRKNGTDTQPYSFTFDSSPSHTWPYQNQYGKDLPRMLSQTLRAYQTLSNMLQHDLSILYDIPQTCRPPRTLLRKLNKQLKQLQRWERTVAMRQCDDPVWVHTAHIAHEISLAYTAGSGTSNYSSSSGSETASRTAMNELDAAHRVAHDAADRFITLSGQQRRWRLAQVAASGEDDASGVNQRLLGQFPQPGWELQSFVKNTYNRGQVLFYTTLTVYVTMVAVLYVWYIMLQNHTAQACALMLRSSDKACGALSPARNCAGGHDNNGKVYNKNGDVVGGAGEPDDVMSEVGAADISHSSGNMSVTTASSANHIELPRTMQMTADGDVNYSDNDDALHGEGTTMRRRHERRAVPPGLPRADGRFDSDSVMYSDNNAVLGSNMNSDNHRPINPRGLRYAISDAGRRRWAHVLRHPPRGTVMLFAAIALIALVPFVLSFYMWSKKINESMSNTRVVTQGDAMFVRLRELEQAMHAVEGNLLACYHAEGKCPEVDNKGDAAVRVAIDNFIRAYAEYAQCDAVTRDYFNDSTRRSDSTSHSHGAIAEDARTNMESHTWRQTAGNRIAAHMDARVAPLRELMSQLRHAMAHEHRVRRSAVPFQAGNALATARTQHSLQITRDANGSLVNTLAPWAVTSLTGSAPLVYRQLRQAMSNALTRAATATVDPRSEQSAVLTRYMAAWDILSGIADADLSVWHTIVAAARTKGSAVAVRYDRFLTEVSEETMNMLKQFKSDRNAGEAEAIDQPTRSNTTQAMDDFDTAVDAIVAAYSPLLQLVGTPDHIAALFADSNDDGDVPEVYVRPASYSLSHSPPDKPKPQKHPLDERQSSVQRNTHDNDATTGTGHLTAGYLGAARYASVVTRIPSMASFRALFAHNRHYIEYASPIDAATLYVSSTTPAQSGTPQSIHNLTRMIIDEARKVAINDTVPSTIAYTLSNATEDVIYANLTLSRLSRLDRRPKPNIDVKMFVLVFMCAASTIAMMATIAAVYRIHSAK